ncbi:hypothetical protein HF086_014747 [Spodoptera exigua]|uniref:Protein ALP1-like n=2 Tax=Spodoptera exigua TaxID=7107 RepID=A0A922M870_SPOEX|nr:hypothetical protein HF086_014747 [Spodoptera exigua]
MDPIEVIAIYEALEEERRRKRKYWVHPLNTLRLEIGQFHTLYMQLRLNPDKSFEYYRMSIQSFDVLLNLTKDYITKQNTKLRTAIPPEERLTVTLR